MQKSQIINKDLPVAENEKAVMRFIVIANNYKVSTLFVFCINPSIRISYVYNYITEGFMQMSQIIRDLPAAVTEKVHSQLQTNGKVPTLFVFCINPSLVANSLPVTYYEGFMQI